MIDTHCHLYLPEFEDSLDQIIHLSKSNGVEKIFLPAINSETHDKMLLLEKNFPDYCIPMIGLHPCYVKSNYKEELAIIEGHLLGRKFAGIGECGLDFYWDKSFVTEQYEALEQQIYWAKSYQIPLILHTRNATKETIEVVKKQASKNLTGIFHCFGGTLEEAQEIIDLGFFLGIGGVITYKNSGLDKVIEQIPLENLVLETDAPYLSPVPHRGKTNEPAYLKCIAEKIAMVKNCSFEEVDYITSLNAKKVFNYII